MTRTDAPPNVILILTDDQGYGDLACTGNPWIQTPNIDAFYDDSVRLPDFHVSPLCTPTRGALMSGRRPLRNGAWATTWGRSFLRRDQITMADVFAGSGYATGMFGKWHLGDNYPYRPQDRGFQHVVAHKGGGVGQTPDFWGNSYFDDTYFHNGEPVSHDGYCTDIWFDEAMRWMDAQDGGQPFFCYLATNAPHAPYLVAEKYTAPYRDNPGIPEPAFYGMITNIDENVGRLRAFLRERGLEDNTILIFMTDNGSSGGWRPEQKQGYNAGMRGRKGSYYDGGHRVPCFIRWPQGGLAGGRDCNDFVLHIDLLPTFIELCELKPPDAEFDGVSVAPLLRGDVDALPERPAFLQYRQNTSPPEKWTNAVMTRRWRLVRGTELYDIKADAGQQRDIAAEHPDVVARLRQAHEDWWAEIEPVLAEYCPIVIGSDAENPTRLDAFDLMGDVAWNQSHIRAAMKVTGMWNVEVARAGDFEFRVRRWPAEAAAPIAAALADGSGTAITPSSVRLRIGGFEATQPIAAGVVEVVFSTPLAAGRTALEAWFLDADGAEYAAYYVYVTRL